MIALEGIELSNEVVAALIGSATAVLSMLATQFLIVRRQHIRTQKAALLRRRLECAYGPLDYHLSTLAKIEATDEERNAASQGLREVLSRHGFLLSRQLRADLYRLTQSDQAEQMAAQIFLAFRQEYDRLADLYYEVHLLPQSRGTTNSVMERVLVPYRWVKDGLGRTKGNRVLR